MRKIIWSLLLLLLGVVTVRAQEYYPVNYGADLNNTQSQRYFLSVGLISPSQNGGGAEQTKTYATAVRPAMYKTDLDWGGGFKVKVGETVTPKIYCNSGWLHGYFYIDKGQDGKFDIKDSVVNSVPVKGGDVISYTYYEGTSSTGTQTNNNPGYALSSFSTEGWTPGFYRMRYKLDWDYIDAAGRNVDVNNENLKIIDNGGGIYDLRLHVIGTSVNLSAPDVDNGSIKTAAGGDLPATATAGEAYTIAAEPGEGYELIKITVRNGYNLNEEATVFGMDQWVEFEVSADEFTDGRYTLSADVMNSDVRIIAEFGSHQDALKAAIEDRIADLRAKIAAAYEGDYVNCHPTTAISAANAVINEIEQKIENTTVTDQDLTTINSAITTFDDNKIQFNPTGTYMIVNARRGAKDYDGTDVLFSQGSDLRGGAGVEGKNSHYWTLVPVNTEESTYKLLNGDGTYIGGTGTGTRDDAFLMTDKANAGTIKLVWRGEYYYGMKMNGGNDMHENTGNKIVGYNDEYITNASSWKLLPADLSAYNQYTVKLTGDEPEGTTVIRLASDGTTETAVDGGYFLYSTEATPQESDFSGSGIIGKQPICAIKDRKITVTSWEVYEPFVPTTISGGEFDAETKWYTLQMTASKLCIADYGTAEYIMSSPAYGHDNEDWCFVEVEDGIYQIYNKAKGTGYVLAAPTDMTLGESTNGAFTYATLQDKNNLPEGYVATWRFTPSFKIANARGAFISLNTSGDPAMSHRDCKLAFNTDVMDANSTFILGLLVESMSTTVDLTTGKFTVSSSDGTHHKTWSSDVVDGLTFGTGVDNMQTGHTGNEDKISCNSGASGCTYTLTAPSGYVIKSYSLQYKLRTDNESAKVTVNDVPATTTLQTLENADYNKSTMSFAMGGQDNDAITLFNFNVTLERPALPEVAGFEVFPAPYNGVVHRIPAIAQASNGDIIAVADYRYSGADIGMATNGKLDLNVRRSSDNGKTWTAIATLAKGLGAEAITGTETNVIDVAFGDPCIVADRESDEVLVMSCAGNVSYPSGTPEKHQYVVIMRSHDNGVNWDKRVDVTKQFYDKYEECTIGKPKAMFIGSGKISQSQYIKKDRYYRIYCAVLFKDEYNVEKNYVYYSDDFGTTWDVLGGVNVAPIPSGANEPKADELPDGSVVVSSRISGGRMFNIFQYTDPLTAEGSWGTVATSAASNNGTVAKSNSTNGEILTVPVKRKADGQKMFLFLQSVPLGPNRANVAIYYKALESLADFDTAEHLASDWDGHYQVSYFPSAYSTMTLLDNGSVGFLYEEDLRSSAYSIVYKNYTIEKLTGDQYEYCADVDESVMIKSSLNERLEAVKGYVGPYVGNLTSAGYLSIEDAYNTYMKATSPTKLQYVAFNKAVADAPYHTLEAGRKYYVHNKAYPTDYLTMQDENPKVTVAALSEGNAAQKLTFSAGSVNGSWIVKSDDAAWLGKTGSVDGDGVYLVTAADKAVGYEVVSDKYGLSYFRCLSPENTTYPCLHVNELHKVVRWESSANASQWYIKPATESAAEQIDDILIDCKDELAMAGKVGAPKADNVNVATFQEAFDDAKTALLGESATGDDLTALTAARDAYRAVTDVQMPEAGKAYRIRNVKYSETAPTFRTVYMTGDASKALESGHEDHGDAEIFVCTKDAAGKFSFFSPKYGSAISCRGVSEAYNQYVAAFELQTMNNRDFSGVMPPVGGFSFKAPNRDADGGNANPGALIANHGTDTFRDAGDTKEPFYNTSWSTIYVLEEVPDYRNKISFLKLNEQDFYVATYSAPYATVLPEGVTAYAITTTATEGNETVAKTTALKGTGTAIPANTGVLLSSETAIDPQHMAPATTEDAKTVPDAGNLLKPSTATPGAGNTYILSYLLASDGESIKENSVNFYRYDVANNPIGSYRAYLQLLSAPGRTLRIIFGDDIETGIDHIEGTENIDSNTAIYDLSGRRIQNPVKGGLYIKGGVKYVHQ